ncbi:MAG TPA: ATP-binding protein [Candidatus Polarisedimenticolaceae bacterium]|nr:ATP-binding protein [Candidatus Polarisedimenticolaceae bacterium]
MVESRDDRAPAAAHPFLAGGGEMGARMRALDWSRTPLGPPETWPQSLRSPLSMLLPSRAQIILFWGPQFTVFYNDAYRPVFGAKHPHALGLPGSEAWSEIWDTQLHGLLASVVRTGEAFWAKDLLFTLERHGFAEETYFDVSYDPVREESGGVGGVFCIVTETTERVVGERRMALLKDLAARNAAARTPHEACVLAMGTLAARPHDVPFALAYLDGTLQSCTPGAQVALDRAGRELVQELPISASGRLVLGVNPRRPLDASYRAFLELVADQLGTALVNARAYEEERKRAEALAELDRAKTMFFSNVSHEFRTPLTLMLGPLEEVLASERGQSRELLAVVHRNGQRLLKLVNTLLDFSRIEAGRAQASYACTDLGTFTSDLASNFRAACERAGLALVVDCPPGTKAWVDRDLWEKIVLNLLSNAFKFTLQGSIEVRLRTAGTGIQLTVTDTGIGIPQASLPRVFERFHRVEGARGRSHEGSGIGLALVQELVRLHGGTIGASSAVGRGTTFTVEIPEGRRHLPEERIAKTRPARSGKGSAGAYLSEVLGWLPGEPEAAPERPPGAARVLVVDDNADLRAYASRLLAEHYAVEAVADGQEALAHARTHRPDLILTDVMMPRLDGFGLIRELRADPALSAVPVILLSARAGEEARLEGMSRGADDYLVKPFTARELLVRAESVLRSYEVRREADRRKDEFLATLSHELRNPLAPLRNALHMMRLSAPGEPGVERAREIMERQVNHLVRLVDDLLEMARINRGTLELRVERVELAAVLGNALETSEPLITAAGHRLQLSLPEEPLWLQGDRVRLAQILANLLNNAAKYTPAGGAITVEGRAQDGEVRVEVHDTGRGIPPEWQSRIFEMFSRGTGEREHAQGGLGIGLALSRRLAEMHGGTLEARSEGSGKGSTFVLRLPLASPPAPVGEAMAPSTPPLPPLRILVVDDNRDAAASLGMVLGKLGAQVEVAHDGSGALETFGTFEPAVVLLDIGMPGMDGYEVARALRERDPGGRTTLVALTGWGQEEARRRALEAGFTHHLVKPADLDGLRRLLSAIGRREDTPALG